MTDFELLLEYAATNSERAFATLVDRYGGLVYSAALRQTGDVHVAEEISQTVFIILARKSGTLSKNTILPGWLLRTARFVALNARRRELHRLRTEHEAATLLADETEKAWVRIAPLLDDALVCLSEPDRDAVVLRFFERRSFKEIAEIIGSSEDAAHKRVSRALKKLRIHFVKNGVVLSATLLVAAISTRAVSAAPGQLTATISRAVISAMGGGGTVSALTKLTLNALETARRQTRFLRAAGFGAGLVVLLMVCFWWKQKNSELPSTVVTAAQSPPVSPMNEGVPATAQVAPATFGRMLLRVLDAKSAAPVAGATLTVVWDAGIPNCLTNVLMTDDRGECWISFDPAPRFEWRFRIDIFKDGYVSRFVAWSAFRGDMAEEIPAEYQTKLTSAAEIGGLVVDETRKPIPNAAVVLGIRSRSRLQGDDREREGWALDHTEFTDAQGRWRCSHVPSAFDRISFLLRHPDYLAAIWGVSTPGTPAQPGISYLDADDFRSQTATMVLKPGITVSGIVMDEAGKPISGAKVTQNRQWLDPRASQTADVDGRFHWGNISGEKLIVTAEAPGLVAGDVEVQSVSTNEALRLALSAAAVLRGRVVDETGKAVKASIVATGPRYDQGRFDWSTATDDKGGFEWLSAPPAQRRYYVSAPGYQDRRVELTPDGVEHVITLSKLATSPWIRVSGNVTDAQAERPIENFQVLMGYTQPAGGAFPSGAQMDFAPDLQTTGSAGKFAFLTAIRATTYTVEIRAEGYAVGRWKISGPLTNALRLDCRLTNSDTGASPPDRE